MPIPPDDLETLCEEAARHWPKHDGLCVRDVRIHQALVLDHERSLRLETQFDPTTHRVQLHSRDADADIGPLISSAASAGVRGVLHCFTGTHALAELALSVGWYVSFSGIVTFRKWDDLALLRLVPEDRLLVESDAPYLAPVPFRGKRNEPSFVPRTVERLAVVREVATDVLAARTAENAVRLFGLAMPDVRS